MSVLSQICEGTTPTKWDAMETVATAREQNRHDELTMIDAFHLVSNAGCLRFRCGRQTVRPVAVMKMSAGSMSFRRVGPVGVPGRPTGVHSNSGPSCP